MKIGGEIVPSEEKTESGTMTGGIFSYASAGNTAGYRVVDETIKYFTYDRKTFTISGLDTDAELNQNISVSGDKITISKDALAQGNATLTTSDNFTMEFDGVSAATLTDENWSGLNYQTEYCSAEGWEIDGNNINYTGTTTPTILF